MNIKVKRYREKVYGLVQHAVYSTEGKKDVKILLIPAKKKNSDIVVLNNNILLNVADSWSALFSLFMSKLNKNIGKKLTDEDIAKYMDYAVEEASKMFISIPKTMLNDNFNDIVYILNEVASGKKENINFKKLAENYRYMNGPFNMNFILNKKDNTLNKHSNNRCLLTSDFFNEKDSINELITKDWLKVIEKCKGASVASVTFSGGKPTEIKDLIDLISSSKWFNTTLKCTGKNITDDYAKSLSNAGLDNIEIILYSSNKDIHNKLAGEENYDLVVEGIKNSIKHNLEVTVKIPICKLNSDIITTAKFLSKLGIKNISISVMDSNIYNKNNFVKEELTKKDIIDVLTILSKYGGRNNINISFVAPNLIDSKTLSKLNIEEIVCACSLNSLCVMPNGLVYPCEFAQNKKLCLGDMVNDSWEKIWKSRKIAKIKKIALDSSSKCTVKKYLEK